MHQTIPPCRGCPSPSRHSFHKPERGWLHPRVPWLTLRADEAIRAPIQLMVPMCVQIWRSRLSTNPVGRAYSRAVFRRHVRLAATLAPPAGLWVQFASFGSWNLSPDLGHFRGSGGNKSPDFGQTWRHLGTEWCHLGTESRDLGTLSPDACSSSLRAGRRFPQAGTKSRHVGTPSPGSGTNSADVGSAFPHGGTVSPDVGGKSRHGGIESPGRVNRVPLWRDSIPGCGDLVPRCRDTIPRCRGFPPTWRD